ncbi:hypothetical protein SAMN03159338_1549 [Sphingomonas sp. NFR04]|uniref:hypothetical protein n=1 Tax=Sphingomonas sp. NFR04 TaxID=1566283 RepID=UPI0008E374AF|nr:hypothetical protein [Sphingomonas sp. NFR04]SFJ49180.1 hypothetical protein SAMN03159338_1549 [Sphingomonas sp. NFR04]
MSRKRNRNSSPKPAADAADNTQATTALVVATDLEDPVDAALAAIQAEMDETNEIMSLADVEEVTIDVTPSSVVIDVATGNEEIEDMLAAAEEAEEDEFGFQAPADGESATAQVASGDVSEVIANDADALLAEIEAAESVTKPAKQKSARKPKIAANTTPAAAPAPARDFHSIAAIDPATLKANLDACAAKKVQEKAQNLIQSIAAGKRLSRYTSVAVRRLVADGMISGKSLVAAYEGENLSTGTARAQAQQMTALFKITGLVQPSPTAPRDLVIADQALAAELVKLAA